MSRRHDPSVRLTVPTRAAVPLVALASLLATAPSLLAQDGGPGDAPAPGWPAERPASDADPASGGSAADGAAESERAAAAPADGAGAFAPWLPSRIEGIVRRAIRGGATPGAAVAVGHRGRIVLSRGFGRLDWAPGAPPVTDSTVYDLASLTKSVVTATAAMQLVEEGRLDLDAPVHRYLPEWPVHGTAGRVRVRDLLSHRSGLPAGGTLWRRASGRADYVRALARTPLGSHPGASQRYSDYGMILLGFVVEAAGGATLDWQARERIFGPLGMSDTGFRPSATGADLRRIAPTERLPDGHLRGEVHDPNARALGGVAGHAGLFSSARDLSRFAAALLWEEPGALACRPLVEGFTRDPDLSVRYALGWESASRWSRWGEHFSPLAFGHTGFTGTSIWIDPANDLFVVILTNRVNPSSRNRGHLDLRDRVHRAIRDALPAGGEGMRRSEVWRPGTADLGGIPVGALRAEWEARRERERAYERRTVGDGVRLQSSAPCRTPPTTEEIRRAVVHALTAWRP